MTEIGAAGLITFTFDDGLRCQYENGYPLFRQLGIKAVAFIPTGLVGGWFGAEPSMSLTQLKELSAAGWEIGSHSVSHARLAHKDGRTRLPLPLVEMEVGESKSWLLANGFSVTSFAYPAGRYNDEVEAITQQYYPILRTSKNGLNDVRDESNRLKVFNLHQQAVDRWKLAVNQAKASRKWLIAMIHGVASSPNHIPAGRESLWIPKNELAECLKFGLTSGLPVLTLQQVYAARQKLNAST